MTMSPSNEASAGLSGTTLTPGIDGLSDYQQYLEKTSRNSSSLRTGPRREGSVANSTEPLDDMETKRQSPTLASNPPTTTTEIQYETTTETSFGDIERARKQKTRKSKPHRVEQADVPNEHLSPIPLALLTLGICLSVFLVSLDRTIVATVGRLRQS